MSTPNSNGLPTTYVSDPASSVATVYLVNTAVAATGSNAATAAALTINGFTNVTGASGTNGVILPAGTAVGSVAIIQNASASALLVYPPTGGNINSAGTNVAATVPANSQANFLNADGTAWSGMIPGAGTPGPPGPPGADTNILRVDPAFVVPLPGGYATATRDWYSASYQFYDCTPSGAARGLVLPGGATIGTVLYLYNGSTTNAVVVFADTLTSDFVWNGDGTAVASASLSATAAGVFVKVDATHWSYVQYKGASGGTGSGLPAGGTPGQTIVKASSTDYNGTWGDYSASTTSRGLTADATYTLTSTGTATIEVVSTNRTYYVSSSGNDSNSGLTVGTPFLTLQKAIDTATGFICAPGVTTTIQMADGTYSIGTTVFLRTPQGPATSYILQGNAATPANVLVSTSGAMSQMLFYGGGQTPWEIKDMTVQSSHGATLFRTSSCSVLNLYNIRFGATTGNHILANFGSRVTVVSNGTIFGGAANHYFADLNGQINPNGRTMTLIGTPAFTTAFVTVTRGSILNASGMSFVGSATGTRYAVTLNAIADTGGGGANYFPGNGAGSAATGGQYV